MTVTIDKPPAGLGLVGLGTVGQGVVRLLEENHDEIRRRLGREVRVVAASVQDPNKQRNCNLEGIRLLDSPQAVIDDPEVDVVVELIGGEGIAREAIESAIAAGKSVVTANKALLAIHGEALFAAAQDANVEIGYEASVAGGIPVIKAIREGLAANRIEWLAGIINGTGNYILTAMTEDEEDFETALARAQELGYAEADPTFDVEGQDAAHKLAILTTIAFGVPLHYNGIVRQGISAVEAEDIRYAGELGYRIKHLGIARRRDEGIEVRVHPALVRERELLAEVDGVMNAIMVYGNQAGPTVYYGAGAGGEATASAVVADCIDLLRRRDCGADNTGAGLGYITQEEIPVLPPEQCNCAWYLRMRVEDKPGVLATISGELAKFEISIEAIHQDEPEEEGDPVNLVLLTSEIQNARLDEALSHIENESFVLEPVKRLRVEHLES